MIRSFFILLTFTNLIFAQFVYDSTDVEICKKKFDIAVAENLSSQPIGEVIVSIAKTFLGTPYVAHTLEASENEEVVVHLSGLDCYTFYETSLALARAIKQRKYKFEDYLSEIENIRYRNGKRKDYISRLHYAVDWLLDNQRRGIIKDITKSIGGVRLEKSVGFMSAHPQYYKHLKDNPDNIRRIKEVEKRINEHEFYFIPQDKIESVEDKIKSGDIIFCTTSIDGLIVGHTGMALKSDDGRIHFLHAPMVGKKVQITKQPLADYVRKVKKHNGIIVLRPLEPEQ